MKVCEIDDRKIYAMIDKIEDLRMDRNNWTNTAKQRKRENLKLKQKLKEIRSQLDALKTQKKEWKQKLNSMHRDTMSWKNRYLHLERDRTSQRQKGQRMEWENQELYSRVTEWKRCSKNLHIKSKSLGTDKNTLKDQMTKIDKERTEWKKKANLLENDLLRVTEQRNQFKDLNEKLSRMNDRYCRVIQALRKQAIFRKEVRNYYSVYSPRNQSMTSYQSIMSPENIATKEIIRNLFDCAVDDDEKRYRGMDAMRRTKSMGTIKVNSKDDEKGYSSDVMRDLTYFESLRRGEVQEIEESYTFDEHENQKRVFLPQIGQGYRRKKKSFS